MARCPRAGEITYIVYDSTTLMFSDEYLRESAAQKRVAALNKEFNTTAWAYSELAAFLQMVAARQQNLTTV